MYPTKHPASYPISMVIPLDHPDLKTDPESRTHSPIITALESSPPHTEVVEVRTATIALIRREAELK